MESVCQLEGSFVDLKSRNSELRTVELLRTSIEGNMESHESHVCIRSSKTSASTVLIARFVCFGATAPPRPSGPGPPHSRGT